MGRSWKRLRRKCKCGTLAMNKLELMTNNTDTEVLLGASIMIAKLRGKTE